MCELVTIVMAVWLSGGPVETVALEKCDFSEDYRATIIDTYEVVRVVDYNREDHIYTIEGLNNKEMRK